MPITTDDSGGDGAGDAVFFLSTIPARSLTRVRVAGWAPSKQQRYLRTGRGAHEGQNVQTAEWESEAMLSFILVAGTLGHTFVNG